MSNGCTVSEYLEAISEDDAQTKLTRKVSSTDPAASNTGPPGGPAFYAYSTKVVSSIYLVDTDHGIIVDVEPSTAKRSHEAEFTKNMIKRVYGRFWIKPQRLIDDTAYGKAAMLNWIVETKQIEPHIPVWQKYEGKAGLFGMANFTGDAAADHYACAAVKTLQR